MKIINFALLMHFLLLKKFTGGLTYNIVAITLFLWHFIVEADNLEMSLCMKMIVLYHHTSASCFYYILNA